MIQKIKFLTVLVLAVISTSCAQQADSDKSEAYLFTYFTGNSGDQEAIRYALSYDGYNYYALNGNKPIIDSKDISSTGGVRDPHILRGADGKTFYMVVTDMVSANGWSSNRAMVLLKSTDLINWTSTVINIPQIYPEAFGDVVRVWAPQTIYDEQAQKYMIYWSMLGSQGPDIIYYAYANADFTGLEAEPKQLFYSPTNSACIDGDIVYKDGKYHLFFKNESQGGGIRKAISDSLTTGYVQQEGFYDQTDEAVEGSGIFPLIGSDEYILMYDMYASGKYQFTKTSDLEHFKVVDEAISMNFHPRHGTVIPITNAETQSLISKWGMLDKQHALFYLQNLEILK